MCTALSVCFKAFLVSTNNHSCKIRKLSLLASPSGRGARGQNKASQGKGGSARKGTKRARQSVEPADNQDSDAVKEENLEESQKQSSLKVTLKPAAKKRKSQKASKVIENATGENTDAIENKSIDPEASLIGTEIIPETLEPDQIRGQAHSMPLPSPKGKARLTIIFNYWTDIDMINLTLRDLWVHPLLSLEIIAILTHWDSNTQFCMPRSIWSIW